MMEDTEEHINFYLFHEYLGNSGDNVFSIILKNMDLS